MKKIFFLLLGIPVVCFAQGFDDVIPTHPNFQAVNWLQSHDLVEGYAVGRMREFRPEQSVSRAEAVKMLVGAAGLTLVSPEKNPFPDVYIEHWYAPYVQTAVDAGVVTGFADGKFHPVSQVTRAEMLAMALRIFSAPVEEEEGGDWAVPYFEYARRMRVIDGEVATHSALERGEVAEILYRARRVAEKVFLAPYIYSGSGLAGEYLMSLNGKSTASGEDFDSTQMTAAHRTLPFGTRLRIWRGGRSVVVKINDRGPSVGTRVLTLSSKAFALLGGENSLEIDVQFEVFSSPEDIPPAIPEYVRPSLSEERREQPPLPGAVSDKVAELRGLVTVLQKTKPLFNETVSFLGTTFFQNLVMRRPFPQKIVAGTILNFSGTTDERGYETATLFLQQVTDKGNKMGKQVQFTGPISGKNFAFPVILDRAGKFMVGVTLDDEKRSRVETIEVVRVPREPLFSVSSKEFDSTFDVQIVPEEQQAVFNLPIKSPTDLIKIIFTQKAGEKELFLEGGIEDLALSYEWFSQFQSDQNLAFDIFAAESIDGTIPGRTSGWKKLAYQNFEIVPGFLDIELDKISVHDFPRWKRTRDPFWISGKNLTKGLGMNQNAFVTTPSGRVRMVPIEFEGDDFSFRVVPEGWGGHVMELVGDDGEVLFNREIYVSEKWVLPVLPPANIELPMETVSGVRAWINRVRADRSLSPVISNSELNIFAQQYAERMATEDFIAHATPTGQTFKSRIKAANLNGLEFGENLGLGNTLQIALDGLKSSGSHYKNMTERKWKRVGIGIKKVKKGWYVVQVFGR